MENKRTTKQHNDTRIVLETFGEWVVRKIWEDKQNGNILDIEEYERARLFSILIESARLSKKQAELLLKDFVKEREINIETAICKHCGVFIPKKKN